MISHPIPAMHHYLLQCRLDTISHVAWTYMCKPIHCFYYKMVLYIYLFKLRFRYETFIAYLVIKEKVALSLFLLRLAAIDSTQHTFLFSVLNSILCHQSSSNSLSSLQLSNHPFVCSCN